MGSSGSKGRDNDELVNNLLADNFLKTYRIEQVFRAVDRGLYFTKDSRKHAYDDTAWRSGYIHLSAPGIYCEVMENLELGQGMSFLNLGSGTGYLNTMAGLLLGSHGVNYGVEIHSDVIQFAYERLEKFKRTAEAIDEYDFCEPKFFEGNCLQLSSENRLYDRVYCGAACPPTYENYMKNLIKIGGILVMPLEEVLVKVKRVSAKTWEKESITSVNFANMILPSPCDTNKPPLLLSNPKPLALQVMCRASIRQILRDVIEEETMKSQKHRERKERRLPESRGSVASARVVDSDSIRMLLLHKRDSSFTFIDSYHRDDEDDDNNDDEDDDDDVIDDDAFNNSDSNDVKVFKASDDSRQREESNERETDDEDEGNFGQMPPCMERFRLRVKRKKGQQVITSTSSSESGTDVEEMDVECEERSVMDESAARKKTDNGEKPAEAIDDEGRRKSDSDSAMSDSPTNGTKRVVESTDDACCSCTLRLGSSPENNDGAEEKRKSVRHSKTNMHEILLQYPNANETIGNVRVHKTIMENKSYQSRSDKEQSDDECGHESAPEAGPSYSSLMREKIRALPLPPTIQLYLNFYRKF